jgi:transketolase
MAKAIRDIYGEELLRIGGENENIVALDADLSGSTRSGKFGKAHPDRFFNVGIAESNMMSIAAGLSLTGKIPFVNTFAVFMTTLGLISARGLIAYTKLNVKLMGAYGGVSATFDGPSHHAIEDLSIMRSLANFVVLCPCDEYQTRWMVQEAVRYNGPMYIRLSRDVMPISYNENSKFKIGGSTVLNEGSDCTVFACGVMVSKALEAAKLLAKEGIGVRVVDIYSIKPIDKEEIVKSAELTGCAVTAEEHSIMGGMGSAVCEALCKGCSGIPVEMVGIQDTFTETGAYKDLLHKLGLDTEAVAKAIKKAISRKAK